MTLRSGLLATIIALALCLPASATSPEAWRSCLEPKKVDPGRAAVPRWFFDTSDATCKEFIWGGVDPNGNNFASKAECKKVCTVPTCELPAAAGSGDVACMAYMPRYAWNSQKQTCEEFIYGGCGGNKNNFATKAACLKRCEPAKVDKCAQPMQVGPCRGAFERFYFDAASKTCQKFIWGGCQANGNNFATMEGCRRRCMARVSRCDQPKEVGPCRGRLPRFYYDESTNSCRRFFYGGCGGNSNKFLSRSVCEKTCKKSDKVQLSANGGEPY